MNYSVPRIAPYLLLGIVIVLGINLLPLVLLGCLLGFIIYAVVWLVQRFTSPIRRGRYRVIIDYDAEDKKE